MKNQGFTLIEVIISTLILSSAIILAGLAFSFFSDRWDNVTVRISESRSKTMQLMRLENCIYGIQDYYIRSPENKPSLVFYGKKEELIAISSEPISGMRGSVVFRLAPFVSDVGVKHYFYQEWSLNLHTLNVTGDLQKILNEKPQTELIIFSELDSISLEFLGVSSFKEYLGANATSSLELDLYHFIVKWKNEYSGSEIGVLPVRIRLKIDGVDEMLFSVPHYNNYKQAFLSI